MTTRVDDLYWSTTFCIALDCLVLRSASGVTIATLTLWQEIEVLLDQFKTALCICWKDQSSVLIDDRLKLIDLVLMRVESTRLSTNLDWQISATA